MSNTDIDIEELMFIQLQEEARQLSASDVVQSDCLPLPVLRALILDDTEVTQKDRDHARECPDCKKQKASLESMLWHPTIPDLLLYKSQLAQPEDAEYVEQHLEQDKCRCCLAVAAWSLQRVTQAGIQQVDEAKAMFRNMSATLNAFVVPPLVSVGHAAAGETPRLTQEHKIANGMIAVLTEYQRGHWKEDRYVQVSHLNLTLQSQNPDHAGKKFRYHLVGSDGKAITGTIQMGQPGLENWIEGKDSLGTYSEVATQLGVTEATPDIYPVVQEIDADMT